MVEKKQFVFFERKKALSIAATSGLSVIEENATIQGYELYFVEQWLCDRNIPTNVISSFTGDEKHTVQVAVIAISETELRNPRPAIKDLLDLDKHKYKWASKTPKGYILLTDISKLPDDMDMVVIPKGDHDAWIQQAYVNINLKRTNCSGRSSLSLSLPEESFKKEFKSLYRIAETVDFNDAVINIVCLVQIALYLFNLLKKDYIDGLICDQTTTALQQFYDLYNPINKLKEYKIKDMWLEPHLLASIISKLIICKNRMQESSHIIIKDPFIEYDAFRNLIGDYQRHKGIPYTKLIDLETLKTLNLHTPTHLKVSRAFKSKFDDISGTTNFSIQEEVSDPGYFPDHAPIESIRMIWRPKLKSKSSKLAGVLFGKATTSPPWTLEQNKTILNISDSHLSFDQSSASESGNSSVTSPFVSVPYNSDSNISSLDEELSGTKENIPDESVTQHTLAQEHSTNLATSHALTKIPSLNDENVTRSTGFLRHSASANDTHSLINPSFFRAKPFLIYPNIPSTSKSTASQLQGVEEQKDSIAKLEPDRNYNIERSSATTSQPIIKIDIETYIMYRKLIRKQGIVRNHLDEVKTLADDFQQMADHLCELSTRDARKGEKKERKSLEFQQWQERLQGDLYNMEERSGMLIYEMDGANSRMKEIEENVTPFYKRVRDLEKNLEQAQKWLATFILISDFFEYYWARIKKWKIFDKEE